MKPILRINDVYRAFRSPNGSIIEALRGIDFSVHEGEFVSIVGASGSGKSTLLRIIDGLLSATKGIVEVSGEPVRGPGPDRAFVFQQDNLLPWRTVIDNIGYGLTIRGMPRQRARQHARDLITLTGLEGFEDYYPHQISGGMRQRVNVARALAVDPSILLLDEPFAALDAQTREIMQSELLRIWSERKKTVLFVTHQIDEAVYLSDRVVVLSSRPGTVKSLIDIDLPRPRGLSIKRDPVFIKYVDEIWGLIETEVRQSLNLPD
jgi:NitT/TauT family transport system ATP-binding protein